MTLKEAMNAQMRDPSKRIIREPNNGYHCISTWFYVKDGVLMVRGYLKDDGVAPFQESEHTDWILID